MRNRPNIAVNVCAVCVDGFWRHFNSLRGCAVVVFRVWCFLLSTEQFRAAPEQIAKINTFAFHGVAMPRDNAPPARAFLHWKSSLIELLLCMWPRVYYTT